jgi:hypothetical protein
MLYRDDNMSYKVIQAVSQKKCVCVVCGERITPERVELAMRRGKTPLYDSTTCSNTAAVRRYRESKKKDGK